MLHFVLKIIKEGTKQKAKEIVIALTKISFIVEKEELKKN
jgi:hypothetical protein